MDELTAAVAAGSSLAERAIAAYNAVQEKRRAEEEQDKEAERAQSFDRLMGLFTDRFPGRQPEDISWIGERPFALYQGLRFGAYARRGRSVLALAVECPRCRQVVDSEPIRSLEDLGAALNMSGDADSELFFDHREFCPARRTTEVAQEQTPTKEQQLAAALLDLLRLAREYEQGETPF